MKKHFPVKIQTICISLTLVFSFLLMTQVIRHMEETDITASIPVFGQVSQNFVIVLDAGHGGMDGGCSSADGIPEKGINLSILLNLRDMLTVLGYRVEVTRDSDRSIHDQGVEGVGAQKRSDMDNRLKLFNQYDNALCLSIHQNKFTDSQYSGAQMFYSAANPQSEVLARILQTKFVENLQPDNEREIKLAGDELFLCYYCKNPAVMVECGFLSNPEEAAMLVTEEYQRKIAFTILTAIQQYLNT